MLNFFRKENIERLDRNLQRSWIVRLFSSHTALAFCYGVFLFLYELRYLRQTVPAVHPFLIAWACALVLYDVLFRRIWEKMPNWPFLLCFSVFAGVTALVTAETGLISNIKAWVLAVLPLVVFYPVCLLETGENRKKALLKAMLGAAVVVFAASLLALMMYLQRFSQVVTYAGETWTIGIRHYIPGDETTAVLLFGIYTDTNHAAAYALAFAAYSLILFEACLKGLFRRRWQNVAGMVFAAANIAVQLCYFPLANSRGGWICLIAALAICVFLWCYLKSRITQKMLRFVAAIMAAVLTTGVAYGGLITLRSGLSEASMMVAYGDVLTPTAPPATQPPVTEPAVTEPAVTEPAVTEPVVTEPAVTEPVVTEPAVTEPAVTESPITEPITEPTVPANKDAFDKVDNGSGSGRLDIWKEGVELFTKRPVLGTGPGNNGYYAQKHEVGTLLAKGDALHNSYLDLLIDYGIVGFVFLMSFWIACLWVVVRRLFADPTIHCLAFYADAFLVLFVAGASVFLSCTLVNTTGMYYLMLVPVGYLMAECGVPKKEK